MHTSLIVAFLVSAVAIAPLAGMWKAHADARAEGYRLRKSQKQPAGFALNTTEAA